MNDESVHQLLETQSPTLALVAVQKILHALPRHARREKLRRVLAVADALFVVRLFEAALYESGLRQAAGQDVLVVVLSLFLEDNKESHDDVLALWRAAAFQLNLLQTYGLLECVDDVREGEAQHYVLEHPKSFAAQGMTLGHRVAKARVATEKEMEPLLLDPDAKVMEAMLGHPRLTEQHVLFAIRQKSATSAVLNVVVKSSFGKRATVAYALAQARQMLASSALWILPYLSAKERHSLSVSSQSNSVVRAMMAKIVPSSS
ncbi:MAG: hypothetical protein GY822_29445 [Deltaproteobacteria bacterium]|nr:hypothetical protein [Deltaproteobacteria bacterium]